MTQAFGPWPKGLNTVAHDSEIGMDELRAAVNLDITNAGRLVQRGGSVRKYSGSDCHSIGPGLLFVEGRTMKRLNPLTFAATTVVSGLTPGARTVYETVNDSIFWTNGYQSGRIGADGVNRPWGLQVPNAPTAAPASGGLMPAGKYQVVLSYQTADGEESGTGLAAVVDGVPDNGAIAITSIPQPTSGQGISVINVFVSEPNGMLCYWHGSVAVGTTTYAVTSTSGTKRQARARFNTAPPPGKLLTYRKGRLFVVNGADMHWTEPLGYGLYDPARNFITMESDIRVARAVTDGWWLVTERRTYFMRGDDPASAVLDPQAEYSAPFQTAIDIPKSNDVAWLSHRGWVIGTAEGEIQNIAEDRVQATLTGERAPTMYRERNGLRQFVGLAVGEASRPVNADGFNDSL